MTFEPGDLIADEGGTVFYVVPTYPVDSGRPNRGVDADGKHWFVDTIEGPIRRLPVIDYRDREQVERLARALPSSWGLFQDDDPILGEDSIDAMQAALREFAAPTPRIEEPTGLGAVVEADVQWEDGKGFGPAKWASSEDGSWVCLTDGHVGATVPWPALANVRILHEGYEAGGSA